LHTPNRSRPLKNTFPHIHHNDIKICMDSYLNSTKDIENRQTVNSLSNWKL
jgi:hypothetical protein